MHDSPAADTTADADLVLRSRSGDADAFAELWQRHYAAGVTVARSLTSSIDPDDLVQEAYTRIFQAIRRGGGPTGAFRAYLFTAIRNTAASWGRSRRESTIDELETVADPASTEEARLAELDRGLTHRAFRSLPTRWQEVLWYTEVEGLGPAEAAPLLGMKAGAAKQLAFRAREGLREAWIQAHIATLGEDSECRWIVDHLGAHARGNLAARNRSRVEAHLQECGRCEMVAAEAREVGSHLALVVLPLVIGVPAAASYLAALARGELAAVALAAMPSAVIEGAVTVGGGVLAAGSGAGATASGGTAGAAGAAAASSAAAGAASAGVFSLSGLVGAGVTTASVAGALLAVTVVPSLAPASATEPGSSVTVQSDDDGRGSLPAEKDATGPVSSRVDPSAVPDFPDAAGVDSAADDFPAADAPVSDSATDPVPPTTTEPASTQPGAADPGPTQAATPPAAQPAAPAGGAPAGQGGAGVEVPGVAHVDVSVGSSGAAVGADVAGGAVKADVTVGGGSVDVGADVAGGAVKADVQAGGGGVSVGAGVGGVDADVEVGVDDGVKVGADVAGIEVGVSVGGDDGLLGVDLGLGGLLR
ncbi:sigma-70 family RNA polymerase sigma factor [Microbacterium sp. JZ31]|uniref:sigma-70 family RNA polymerase sigma factor n=1 Tax=Microbacterium sp. JZ31 TaxID=1906274 RepID=UPI00193448BA|nr:sigma-70 family RNA polymerase sigma factor [Microbacterium sp. JZ31]